MGVINNLGLVGIIDNTKIFTVISILNVKSRINAKIKKIKSFRFFNMERKSTGFVQLIDVPRLASVRKGDTIVPVCNQLFFPENINIGTIEKYTLTIKPHYTLDIKL
jgi:rod shape-determining protein MreC